MNESEMFKLALELDEDVSKTDFCVPSVLEEDDVIDELLEHTESFNKKTKSNKANQKVQNSNTNNGNIGKKSKKCNKNADFKNKYFSYYDDIKVSSNDVEW